METMMAADKAVVPTLQGLASSQSAFFKAQKSDLSVKQSQRQWEPIDFSGATREYTTEFVQVKLAMASVVLQTLAAPAKLMDHLVVQSCQSDPDRAQRCQKLGSAVASVVQSVKAMVPQGVKTEYRRLTRALDGADKKLDERYDMPAGFHAEMRHTAPKAIEGVILLSGAASLLSSAKSLVKNTVKSGKPLGPMLLEGEVQTSGVVRPNFMGRIHRPLEFKSKVHNFDYEFPNFAKIEVHVEKLQNARQVKEVTDLTVHFWQNGIEAVYDTVSGSIRDFANMKHFAEHLQKSSSVILALKNTREVIDSAAFGRSGNFVFALESSEQTIPMYTKQYLQKTDSLQDLAAMKKYDELKLKHALFPKAIAIGKISDTTLGVGAGKTMLAFSSVQGESLNVLIKNLGKLPEKSSMRTDSLNALVPAVDRIGRFLGELHSKNLDIENVPNIAFITCEIKNMGYLIDNIELNGIRVDRLKINQLATDFRKYPGLGSFTHGDAHPPNFFWDGQRLSAIDLATLTRSLGARGNPVGVAARDLEQMRSALEFNGSIYGLSRQEVSGLLRAFHDGYWQEFKGVHTKEALEFYREFWSLYRDLKLAQWNNH
jgi:hypothetical protein